MITRRVSAPRSLAGVSPAPPAPVVQVTGELIYKGHQIEAGSYPVGSAAWSPRAVVSVRTGEGAWQRTPLYATSSARFPTRHEADHSALIVAKAWVDAAVERQRTPGA